jgi:hypothetical protein
MCKPAGNVRFSMWRFFDPGECVACGVSFRFTTPEKPLVKVADRATARLWSMSLPTYQGDKVHVLLQSVNGGCTIEVPHRLDLFSIEVLEKAWFRIPQPRKIVLDVSDVKEFTDRAVARLLALGDGDDDKPIYLTQTHDWHPPSPIASKLMHTRRAFDYVASKNIDLRLWTGAPPVIPVTIGRVVSV